MKKSLIILLGIALLSCHKKAVYSTDLSNNHNNFNNLDYSDSAEILYHQCDTVIRKTDTLIIVNSRFDTTIIESGIFTYLQYAYPLSTFRKLIYLSKKAVEIDKQGKNKKATELFRKIISFYHNDRIELIKEFSDLNDYFAFEVNSSILCSYAYERLGNIDSAIIILQPFLANGEAFDSKIHERYIKLCIDKFGIEKVREEINNCGNTIKLKEHSSPVIYNWVVTIFGAEIGVEHSRLNNKISIDEANILVREMDFYKLIK